LQADRLSRGWCPPDVDFGFGSGVVEEVGPEGG
jgi:hypothetical protein